MYDALGSLLERWRVETVLPVVRGRLLDIGCGRNRVVRRYSGEGVGVDILDWGDADLVVEDAAALPWPDGEFDTITIVAALNHMPNREAIIREAARLLKPGGTVVVTMIPPGVSRICRPNSSARCSGPWWPSRCRSRTSTGNSS